MRIDLVFPRFPPALDGIGDHTARLAEALSSHATVRVLTAQTEPARPPGPTVENAFSYPPRRGVWELIEAIRGHPPDWIFLQFNQFSYGRWGLNPFLPGALYQIKRRCSGVRIAVMFHEDFLPVTSWRNAVMTTWQRAQFWALGRLADRVFFSIDPWVQRYQSWFPGTSVDHLPVGSNIPRIDANRTAVRQLIGVEEGTFILGVFGSLHESRLLPHIRKATESVWKAGGTPSLLYIGPHGDEFRQELEDLPVFDAGCLPAREVSRRFQAMDLYLAPFVDGVSTRRGSFMTGLQHGIPTVSTAGRLTDPVLRTADEKAFRLAPADRPDQFAQCVRALWKAPERRTALGTAGQQLYDQHFAFDVIAEQLTQNLTSEARM